MHKNHQRAILSLKMTHTFPILLKVKKSNFCSSGLEMKQKRRVLFEQMISYYGYVTLRSLNHAGET